MIRLIKTARFVVWATFFNALVLSSMASFAQGGVTLMPSPPQLAASSYILVDVDSGKIIVQYNADERLPPASLTKMMTSYIVDTELAKGRVSLDDDVPISVKAWRMGGSKMFIREGTKVQLLDLLKGVIIQSGNDASVALAEYVAGDEAAFAAGLREQWEAIWPLGCGASLVPSLAPPPRPPFTLLSQPHFPSLAWLG